MTTTQESFDVSQSPDFLSPQEDMQSSMCRHSYDFSHLPEGFCITLIGMAGAGKSTVGRALAMALGWALVDTDQIIEAAYAVPLQAVADALTKDEFLDVESQTIQSLRLNRTVLATGGSVVYRAEAMRHLATLGPVVHLDVPMDVALVRIARNPDRGLAIAPGQTIEDLFREREALYRRYADFTVDSATLAPAQCATAIIEHILALPSA